MCLRFQDDLNPAAYTQSVHRTYRKHDIHLQVLAGLIHQKIDRSKPPIPLRIGGDGASAVVLLMIFAPSAWLKMPIGKSKNKKVESGYTNIRNFFSPPCGSSYKHVGILCLYCQWYAIKW